MFELLEDYTFKAISAYESPDQDDTGNGDDDDDTGG